MLSGTIAGYVGPEPYMTALVADGRVHKLFDFGQVLSTRMTSGLLATTDRVLKARPGLAGAVVAALADADAEIRANPEEAARIFLDQEKSLLSLPQMSALLGRVGAEFQTQPVGADALAAFMVRTGQPRVAPAGWREAFFPPVAERAGS